MSDSAYITAGDETNGVGVEEAVSGKEPASAGPNGGGGNGKRVRSSRVSISRGTQASNSDDTDAQSSGNDSAEREVESHLRHETCSSRNGKDSAMETTSKSSNSHSSSPPNSSMAYSLLSGSSEQDNPSTSGCSSDQPARLQTQRELLKALKELKIRVPADHRGKGRSSTLASLQYALNCVKQVRANQEYYHQWSVKESHGCSLDLSAFTAEELDNITSEYTLQNTDTFSVGVSFLSGKVVYTSPQASSMLRCKPDRLQGAIFSELLAPQDVSTFYSSTAPCRLPPWSSCNGSVASPVDCTQEKSMFCRVSRGRASEGEVRYYPFRLTPYQLTLRDSDFSQPQPCCLLIAERVHSGYEAPRIPADKRIFTTSHTPSCLFQEVDERAVPLLGYLPQDLVGTPMLMYLHPDDRPLMVGIHKRILQSAGQPFEHSPLRICARNGEYLTIDTSWSSFVNPWSRKVAFIVGRHKVRTSPLNEDVFTPREAEARPMSPEIPLLSEQIHRVLVHPVRGGTAGGVWGGGRSSSTRSRSQQSSSRSSKRSHNPSPQETQAPKPMTFQQMCKDVHTVKANGQQVFIKSRNRPPPRKHAGTGPLTGTEKSTKVSGAVSNQAAVPPPRRDPAANYSYQQVNCLDSIIRYLESCNVPNTVKRKCASSSHTTSSTSDDDKQRELSGSAKDLDGGGVGSEGAKEGHPLSPLALHCKAESVVSVTSQCSFSSTIVHVGDKKPPESDIVMMDESLATPSSAPTTTSPAPPANTVTSTTAIASATLTPQLRAQTSPAPPPSGWAAQGQTPQPEREASRPVGGALVGLTKEVLSAHTQQEEHVFLSRFRDLEHLRVLNPGSASSRGHNTTPKGVHCSQDYPAGSSGRRRGRGGKRLKHQQDGSHQHSFHGAALQPPSGTGPNGTSRRPGNGQAVPLLPSCPPLMLQGPLTSSTSWPTSVASQASLPPVVAPYPPGTLPFYPFLPSMGQPLLAQTAMDPNLSNSNPQTVFQIPLHSPQLPLLPPMMMVLPVFPQLNPALAQFNPAMGPLNPALAHLNQTIPQFSPAIPVAQLNPPLGQYNPNMAPLTSALSHLSPSLGQLSPSLAQLNPALSMVPPEPFWNPNPTALFPNVSPRGQAPHGGAMDSSLTMQGLSRSSTPQYTGPPPAETPDSPLFQSRCSSPLNLLQLEELPGNRQEGVSAGARQTPPPPGRNSVTTDPAENNNNNADVDDDAMSTSSDLLDLLLQEDACSGTGSAASGSGSSGSGSNGSGSSGSGSNGCSTSGSGTRSSNTSKYFGSIDSSENDHSHKQAAGGADEDQLMKYVLQDPIWLLMANTDDKVMMTYQMPSRDRETVLRKDRMMLRAVQKQQPHFSDAQRKELLEVHPWMATGGLPQAIDTTSCPGCSAPHDASSPQQQTLEEGLHGTVPTRARHEEVREAPVTSPLHPAQPTGEKGETASTSGGETLAAGEVVEVTSPGTKTDKAEAVAKLELDIVDNA
ncbi:period circadian protein homolog 1 [Aplochiton taeniatus]